MDTTDIVDYLSVKLRERFPHAATNKDRHPSKALPIQQHKQVADYVHGFVEGLIISGNRIPQVIAINMAAGRCDRFLTKG